jgi:hypothetical protein
VIFVGIYVYTIGARRSFTICFVVHSTGRTRGTIYGYQHAWERTVPVPYMYVPCTDVLLQGTSLEGVPADSNSKNVDHSDLDIVW